MAYRSETCTFQPARSKCWTVRSFIEVTKEWGSWWAWTMSRFMAVVQSACMDGIFHEPSRTCGCGPYRRTVTSKGPAGTGSQAYSVEIVFAPPVAVDDAATVLAGESVTIAVTANDTSAAPIDSIAIVTPPAEGTAVVSGLEIIYTAPTLASPTVAASTRS